MDDLDTKIEAGVKKVLGSTGFTARKITDTPTDALQVVNRKFVTANGATASRSTAPVIGQFFFDTSIGKPVWWNGSGWVLATGSPG